MKLVLRYVLRKKGTLIANALCVLGWIAIELGLPSLFAYMVDNGLATGNREVIWQSGVAMAIISLIGLGGQLLLAVGVSRVATWTVRDIRNDLYRHIQTFSHAEFEKFGINALITCITNDGYQVLMFLQQALRTGFMTPMMFIASMVMIVVRSPSLSTTIVVAVLVIGLGIALIMKTSNPISHKQQKGLDRINGQMREMLSGLRVIRSFNREEFESERFEKVNQDYATISQKLFRIMGVALPIFFFIFHIVIAVVIWISSKQISLGKLQLGDLIAFNEYVFHALYSFLMLSVVIIMYPRAATSADRIQAVMETESSISTNEDGVRETTEKGRVAFEDVSFHYPDEEDTPVLSHVSFTAEPGQVVAFIGSTGSGKSTLIRLIPRSFDVTGGRVLVDGVDVRDFNLKSLRSRIAYIPQRALLFSGTIAQNIRFGKHDATEHEVDKAAEIAQARQFIHDKEGGYGAYLSEGGSNMSGGQKQRLSIARAVIKKPEIFIFDDSFSALDFKTDAKVRERLEEETNGATTLIVAQRIGTILEADKIIVLDKGEIVAEGTHMELLNSSEIYRQIAQSQLSEEDLAQWK